MTPQQGEQLIKLLSRIAEAIERMGKTLDADHYCDAAKALHLEACTLFTCTDEAHRR